jgi:hypothetical protein
MTPVTLQTDLDKILATATMIKQAFGNMTGSLATLIGSATQLLWQRVEGIAATVNTVLYGLFSAISDAPLVIWPLSAGANSPCWPPCWASPSHSA